MTSARARVFGRAPASLVVPALAGLAILVVPVVAVFIRAPWRTLPHELDQSTAATALRLSLETTLTTLAVCLLVGVPLGWVLARVEFRGRVVVRSLVTLPLVLPPVVGGLALLLALGRTGVVGGFLYDRMGVTIAFTTAGVVLAQTFVALPFLVISVEGAFRASDARYDEAAATLGASRWLTFRRVTLPLTGPGIVAGAVLCWARALGEFGATITFNGSTPGTTQTMPSAIYSAYQTDFRSAIALSLVLIVVSVAILAALRERWIAGIAP